MPIHPVLRHPVRAIAHLLPNRCLLCGANVRHATRRLCLACEGDLPRIATPCQSCGLLLASGEGSATCAHCRQSPPPFTRTVAPLAWATPVNRLVSRYKYRADIPAGRVLAETLLHALQTAYADEAATRPTLLVPVPMHWRRVLWRGFDHAAVLSHTLGNALQLPVETRLLHRTRHAKPQRGQSRAQRQHNLRGAFAVTRPLHGGCIALIDDVMTTGSTAHELANVLLSAGASEVHVWALARVPTKSFAGE